MFAADLQGQIAPRFDTDMMNVAFHSANADSLKRASTQGIENLAPLGQSGRSTAVSQITKEMSEPLQTIHPNAASLERSSTPSPLQDGLITGSIFINPRGDKRLTPSFK